MSKLYNELDKLLKTNKQKNISEGFLREFPIYKGRLKELSKEEFISLFGFTNQYIPNEYQKFPAIYKRRIELGLLEEHAVQQLFTRMKKCENSKLTPGSDVKVLLFEGRARKIYSNARVLDVNKDIVRCRLYDGTEIDINRLQVVK